MRVSERKTEKNTKAKGLFRSAIKKTREAVSKGNKTEAAEWLKKASKALDKAAEKNVIHKNSAARKKSRLNKIVKSLATQK